MYLWSQKYHGIEIRSVSNDFLLVLMCNLHHGIQNGGREGRQETPYFSVLSWRAIGLCAVCKLLINLVGENIIQMK